MRWRLLLIGVFIALVVELCGVRSLPFSVGMYFPLAATATMLLGALIFGFAQRGHDNDDEDILHPGMLYSSGLIADGAICAIAITLVQSTGKGEAFDLGRRLGFRFLHSSSWALVLFAGLTWMLWRESRSAD